MKFIWLVTTLILIGLSFLLGKYSNLYSTDLASEDRISDEFKITNEYSNIPNCKEFTDSGDELSYRLIGGDLIIWKREGQTSLIEKAIVTHDMNVIYFDAQIDCSPSHP